VPIRTAPEASMAKRTHDDGDTAVMDQPETTAEAQPAKPLTRTEARDAFVNRCLRDWGLEQFLNDRGCKPEAGHVDSLVEKATRLFDRLFEKRPITSNLR
jgi:hypothetical protein